MFAVTVEGKIYACGEATNGRLGLGLSSGTIPIPRQITALSNYVKVLLGHRVIQVACGSRDAQTLALTDEGLVFSWGDGDFGKLGRGGSEGCNIPQNIERLNGQGVCQIECGAQFSLALTKSGAVWTWGKGDYFRLGHGTDVHVRKPQMVDGLRGKKIVHVAVGALHCLAVTDTGQVSFDHYSSAHCVIVPGLEGQKITRVACGSSHSVAWTTVDVTTPSVHEPVLFQTARDSLGASYLENQSKVVGPEPQYLDEFTSLLVPDDTRVMVDLLKLAVSCRSGEKGKEVLSAVLSGMGTAYPQVADMLLELCVTELEDVATDSQSGRLSSQPVVVESSHPYTDDTSTSGTVKIPGPKDLLSDRCILSCPSMDLVTCLLDFRLNFASNRSIVPRLAASLAACAQLSALAAGHRMWALQRLRKLLTTEYGQSININRLLGDSEGEARSISFTGSALAALVKGLPEALQRQYEYEDPIVRGGKQLLHTCDLELDTLPCCAETHKWAWFRRYCTASRVAIALDKRTSLPRAFLDEVESVSTPTLLESIQHVFIRKVAVNSGGKHCLALSSEGEVYSWGEAEDGKLGHGTRSPCDRPRVIESLRGVEVVDIAAGGAHSACITASGELFTWGKGRYGRLGHGDSEDQLKPKLVDALQGHRVIDVACGSGDAQTLCLTDDDMVWSWGDGDYGKLGRGGSDGCKIPMKCGSQFSVALTKSGAVYTWGKGDYHRLGHGSDDHVRRPRQVQGLQGKKVIAIATGSLHCVCCTEDEVYTWGDNDEGQLGDGTTNAIQRPRLVAALQGKKINRVACGSAHTLAWSTSKPTNAGKLPAQVPMEYNHLQEIPIMGLRNRLLLLHHFSELFCPCIPMFDLEGRLGQTGHGPSVGFDTLRGILISQGKVKRSRSKGGLAGPDGTKSVFGQMCAKMSSFSPDSLLLPHRVWKVKFVGESVDDCGGGYSESIAEMCEELQNSLTPLLIVTPNGRDESGANRDCFLLNPAAKSSLHMSMFRFLGIIHLIS
ncbi:hypothetical protein XENOCAPTIV_001890 [Xenoophorus captivus]|uniref:Uncharacterized protein n=1 Tax=Xenoophorus captivus TaxID=1517983 RepID=A0ABV0RBK7_9TELE